jgi:hypothetical protein
MNDLDLCYMPGFLLQEQFRKRSLSPVELLEAQIRRAEAVNCREAWTASTTGRPDARGQG